MILITGDNQEEIKEAQQVLNEYFLSKRITELRTKLKDCKSIAELLFKE